jgi:hypothetical protein
MTRKLNPGYIRRIMAKDELRGMEVVYLTGSAFNVSQSDDRLPAESRCVGRTSAGGYRCQIWSDYHGWTKEGKLYCGKCRAPLVGVPREIIRRNWCEACGAQLYPEDDSWLDMRGFDLYRERATIYLGLAVRKYRHLLEGCERLLPNGRMQQGDHKDHIYSVRDGFENDVPPFVISGPPNIRVIHGGPNQSKGRKSDRTLGEMLARYDVFLRANPEWPELAEQLYLRQETFVCDP